MDVDRLRPGALKDHVASLTGAPAAPSGPGRAPIRSGVPSIAVSRHGPWSAPGTAAPSRLAVPLLLSALLAVSLLPQVPETDGGDIGADRMAAGGGSLAAPMSKACDDVRSADGSEAAGCADAGDARLAQTDDAGRD